MNLVVAADPFAVTLKDAIVAHLKEKGYNVTDVGATTTKDIPYYESVVPASKLLQEKEVVLPHDCGLKIIVFHRLLT